MRHATLIRQSPTADGTFGTLTLDDGTQFATGELPWKNNAHGVSCIPAGEYPCRWITSPKHGECYQVVGVPGRSMIEIHSANFMGDAAQGRRAQLLGCIALGKSVGVLDGQFAVLSSKVAVAEFEANLGGDELVLTIVGEQVCVG